MALRWRNVTRQESCVFLRRQAAKLSAVLFTPYCNRSQTEWAKEQVGSSYVCDEVWMFSPINKQHRHFFPPHIASLFSLSPPAAAADCVPPWYDT